MFVYNFNLTNNINNVPNIVKQKLNNPALLLVEAVFYLLE